MCVRGVDETAGYCRKFKCLFAADLVCACFFRRVSACISAYLALLNRSLIADTQNDLCLQGFIRKNTFTLLLVTDRHPVSQAGVEVKLLA